MTIQEVLDRFELSEAVKQELLRLFPTPKSRRRHRHEVKLPWRLSEAVVAAFEAYSAAKWPA